MGRLMGVSPMAIRRGIRRFGRRSVGLFALLLVVGIVQLHHSDLSMGDMQHDGLMNPVAMTICVGMLTAVGAAVVAVAFGLLSLGRWPIVRRMRLYEAVCDRTPMWVRARAGPPPLLLFCVSRR